MTRLQRMRKKAQRRAARRAVRSARRPSSRTADYEAPLVRVWQVGPMEGIPEPITIVEFPGDDLVAMLGDHEKCRRVIEEVVPPDMTMFVIEGVGAGEFCGLASTDPEWDGEETFACSRPTCRVIHNAHENIARNVYNRLAKVN